MSALGSSVRGANVKSAPDHAGAAKSVDAFRTISEVSDDLEVPQHVLRFWEGKFAQIKPLKRGGGRRYYRPDDVDLLRGIRRLLHVDGYTIKGVQKVFRDQGARMVVELGRGTILRLDATDAARAGLDEGPSPSATLAMPAQASVSAAPAPAALAPALAHPVPAPAGQLAPDARARLEQALSALDAARAALLKIAHGKLGRTDP